MPKSFFSGSADAHRRASYSLPSGSVNVHVVRARSRTFPYKHQGGMHESYSWNLCHHDVGARSDAWERRQPAKVAQGTARRNLDVRLIHDEERRWEPTVGVQSERPYHFHGQRAILFAYHARRPPEIDRKSVV